MTSQAGWRALGHLGATSVRRGCLVVMLGALLCGCAAPDPVWTRAWHEASVQRAATPPASAGAAPTGDERLAITFDSRLRWTTSRPDEVWTYWPEALADQGLSNVRIDAAVTVQRGDVTFGVICRAAGSGVGGGSSGYVLALRSDGLGEIRRVAGSEVEALASIRDLAVNRGARTRFTAVCREGNDAVQLQLSLDGRMILQAHDPAPLEGGAVGLVAQNGPADVVEEPAELQWHELSVRQLGDRRGSAA